ncbi:family 1 glycosylhydrolase, partial [Microbispora sp. RL4-1S]
TVEPEGLYDTLVGLAGRYPHLPPIYVTENGYGDDGVLEDTGRSGYPYQGLRGPAEADPDTPGGPARGYFCWSPLEDVVLRFEGNTGTRRSRVDYRTRVRTPATGFHWLRDHIAAGC